MLIIETMVDWVRDHDTKTKELCFYEFYFIFNLSDQCFCGDSLDIAWSAYGTANNCDMTCGGDKSSICGGFNAMSVYHTYAAGAK